jgi:Flp pilus assembly protein TadG
MVQLDRLLQPLLTPERNRLNTLSRSSGRVSRERGQTVPLLALFLTGLLGMCGLVIDIGGWYQQKLAMQAAADAAALAGASQLPVGWENGRSAATQQYAKNGNAGDGVTVTRTDNLTAGDSVTVTATRNAPTFFVRLFGLGSVGVKVTARATVESLTGYASRNNVMPFGVMQGDYTLGTSYTIYGDGSSSNNGALSLDLVSGNSCAAANGANDLRDTISGSSNACPISVGQLVDTKPGKNTGPVAQGLNNRMSGGWRAFSQIVRADGNGQYTLLDPGSPQLVMIPIVLNTDNSTTWPNGSSQVKIVGFAWFVITGCGNPSIPGSCANSDGKWVNGTFVGLVNSDTGGSTGAWTPGSNSAATLQLTQ